MQMFDGPLNQKLERNKFLHQEAPHVSASQ